VTSSGRRVDARRDVALDQPHAIAERPRALARQRGELRLHQTERRGRGIASQQSRQQLRSEEAGVAGEEQRGHCRAIVRNTGGLDSYRHS